MIVINFFLAEGELLIRIHLLVGEGMVTADGVKHLLLFLPLLLAHKLDGVRLDGVKSDGNQFLLIVGIDGKTLSLDVHRNVQRLREGILDLHWNVDLLANDWLYVHILNLFLVLLGNGAKLMFIFSFLDALEVGASFLC
jgi:hypothetical protein